MATRLKTKKAKRRRDLLSAYKKGETQKKHKIAVARSKKHRTRAAHPMV